LEKHVIFGKLGKTCHFEKNGISIAVERWEDWIVVSGQWSVAGLGIGV